MAEKDLCDNGFNTECDVYKESWAIYFYGGHCGGEDDGDTSNFRYFISLRHKKSISKKRFCRFVDHSVWTWK